MHFVVHASSIDSYHNATIFSADEEKEYSIQISDRGIMTYSNEDGVIWESKIRTITKYETYTEVLVNVNREEYSFCIYNNHMLYSNQYPDNTAYLGNGVKYGNFYEKTDASGCFDCSYLQQFAGRYKGVYEKKNTSSVVVSADTIEMNITVESDCKSCKLRIDTIFPGTFYLYNYSTIVEDLKDVWFYFDNNIIRCNSNIRNTNGMVTYFLHYEAYKPP